MDLTPEQMEAFNKLTTLQQNVALKKLEGLSDAEAYRQGGGKASNPSSVGASASEILNNPNVKEFIALMAPHRIAPSIATREEIAEFLTGIMRTELTDIVDVVNDGKELIDPETGEIVVVGQSMWRLKDTDRMGGSGARAISELTAGKSGLKVKLHDPQAAAKQLAALYGYDAPTKTEVTVTKSLEEFYGGETDA